MNLLLPTLVTLAPSISSSHPGPPVFVEVEVEEESVKVVVTSEQEALLVWMGQGVPIAEAESTPELERELIGHAARLLRDERGLDLAFEGRPVTYEIEQVKLFDEFGVGNAEPAVQVSLRVESSGEAPSSIAITWGLFDRVEEKSKRVLPILISANTEFDLLRANEAEPTAVWESPKGDSGKGEARRMEPFEPLAAVQAPPLIGGSDRELHWRGARVVGYSLAGLSLLVSCFVRGARRRVLFAGAGALLCLGTWSIGDLSAREDRLLESEALALFERLHGGVYQAFSGRSEDEIYDRLAACVDGPLLDELYSEILRGLVLEDDGGAVCRVEEVEATDGRLVAVEAKEELSAPAQSFGVDWAWRVRGRVIHYGHEHVRENRYRALYRVAPVEGAWRITDVEVLEHERAELE